MLEERDRRRALHAPSRSPPTWAEGHRVAALLDAGERWWDNAWADVDAAAGWDAPWPIGTRPA